MTSLQLVLLKQAAEKFGPGKKIFGYDSPKELVSTTVPVGMEWDYPEQETRFQNLIKDMRPDLSAHLVRGHGGGSTNSMVVRPRSRSSKKMEDLVLNSRNTRAVPEVLAAAKTLHKGNPDLLFLGQCNMQRANAPRMVEDSMGGLPNRLVYSPPGSYSNTGVSGEALRYALSQKRPWFREMEKEFSSGRAKSRALLQPLIPAGASIPAVSGALALAVNEVIQRKRKKKPSWMQRAAVGLGGASIGGLALMLARARARNKEHEGSWVEGFYDPEGMSQTPLAQPV